MKLNILKNSKANSTRTKINIVASIIQRLISTLLPFAIRTIIIYTIGIEYLGIDSLFASILNVLNLSELGFSSAIVFVLYKPVSDNNTIKVKAILTYYKKIYRIIGISILAAGLILLPHLRYLISDTSNIPNDINIYTVYTVLLINTTLSYLLFGYKNSILIANKRNDLDLAFECIRSLISHGLQILALILFKNYYLFILVLPIITSINNIVRNIYINKRFPEYKGNEPITKEDKSDIKKRVVALIGSKIGGVIFNSLDSIVISKILGLVLLAQYTNYNTIFLAVFGFESAIYDSFQSVVGHKLITDSKEKNYKLFKKIFGINIFLTSFCVGCLISLFQPFISLWVGEANVLPNTLPIILTFYFFIRSTRRTLFQFKEAAGMWHKDFLKPYVSVLVKIGLSILLISALGLEGAVLSSIVCLIFIEMPWETTIFFKKYFKRNVFEYLLMILISLLYNVFVAYISYKISISFGNSVYDFILRGLITVVMVAINCLMFNELYKRFIHSY